MSDLQPREVVNRGSKTKLQVVEDLNQFTQQEKGYYTDIYM